MAINDDEDILAIYENDFNKLKDKVLNNKRLNIRTFVVRSLINCGIALDYALPFMIASFIIGCKFFMSDNPPFVYNEVVEFASVETTDTSLGVHSRKISYDHDYNGLIFEHSTGWRIDDEGLYERVSTSYITDGMDFTDVSKIFSMSKEEIEKRFIISNIKTIKKNELEDEDKIYTDDCFVIVQCADSIDEFIIRNETDLENASHSGLYLLLSIVGGALITGLEKIFIKVRIKDKLYNYKDKFVYITNSEINSFESIYKIREENIALLNDNSEVQSYQLRKK